jgi:hypothetical protein
MIEIWQSVPTYEGLYEAGNRGHVRSLPRKGTPGRVLKPHLYNRNGTDYLEVCLHPGKKTVPVHRLVLLAFAGPCPPGQQACHGPQGSLVNWWPENLYWGTPLRNSEDKTRDNTTNRGEKNRNASLTWNQVTQIRQLLSEDTLTQVAVARMFGVGYQAIWAIKHGRTWQHTPEEW